MLKRLSEWLAKPFFCSCDDYLAEQECRIHAQDLADELICEKGDLVKKVDCLTRLNLTLNRDLQEMADEKDTTKYAHTQEVGRLEREIGRLRKLGIEQVEKTPVHKIEIENGAIEVTTRPPHWAMKAMAASFAESLDGAPNWRSIEIGPMPSTEGLLIVTVCRKSGDSPVETCVKLKEMIAEMLDAMDGHECENWQSVEVSNLINRARALINPEKKD